MSLTNVLSFSQFNSTLSQVQRISGLTPFTHKIGDLAFEAKAASVTQLGASSNVGMVINGIQAVSSETDWLDPDDTIDGTGVARINTIPGMESEFEKEPQANTDISAITEYTGKATGFLKEITSGTSPSAIQGAIQSATGLNVPPGVLGAITSSKYAGGLNKFLQNSKTFSNKVGSQIAFFEEAVGSVLKIADAGKPEGGGVMNIAALNTNDVLTGEINQITRNRLNPIERGRVTTLILQGKNKEALEYAIEKLDEDGYFEPDPITGQTELDREDVEAAIFGIDPSLNNIVNNVQETAGVDLGTTAVPAFEMNTDENNWYKAKTPVRPAPPSYFDPTLENVQAEEAGTFQFYFIDTFEELLTDLKYVNREVTEVVVHWSDTYSDQGDVGSEEIHDWSEDGIGYHYVIKRNGDLQKGRPVNEVGKHADGHDNYSIAVCLVAGYACPSGTENPEKHRNEDSITAEQWQTLSQFMNAFYIVWPGGQAWGHNDIDTNFFDPGFDVSDFVERKFGKRNLTILPNSSSLSPSELVALPPRED